VDLLLAELTHLRRYGDVHGPFLIKLLKQVHAGHVLTGQNGGDKQHAD